MMWAISALVVLEASAVHFLVALWNPWVAIALTALSLATLGWLISGIRSFRKMPVVLTDDELICRAGRLKGMTVERKNIAGLRASWTAADMKQRSTFNCALIAYPNVVIDLIEPVRVGRREVSSLAHRLDEPTAFANAINAKVIEA